jgi:hypothetical protein
MLMEQLLADVCIVIRIESGIIKYYMMSTTDLSHALLARRSKTLILFNKQKNCVFAPG